MTKDELESLEGHIRELEALRCYPRVKEERDSLAVAAAQLKQRAKQLEGQLKSEVSTRKELSARISKREAEAKGLAAKLDQAQSELSSLRDFKAKFPGGGELSLEEIKAQLLGAEEEQIERRTKERLGQLEKDIQSRMPSLVHKRLIEVLKRRRWPPEIAEAIDARAKQMADSTLRDTQKWPDWFKDYYLRQVKEAVSQELGSEFEERVQREAERRLEALKAGQWREYAAAKSKRVASGLKAAVGELQGTWWFTCDRCSRRLALEIGPSEIGFLLRGRTVDAACTTCSDPAPFPFLLSTVPHKVGSLTLEGLLRLYMGDAPSAG